jgi:hypothetical protein
MAARLKAEYSPDDLYRIKLMLRTQDAKMAARALRLMQPAIECDSPAVRTSILREVRQMLKDSAEAIKTHSLESEAAKLQENIQAAEANIAFRGPAPSSHLPKSWCRPGSSSLMKTEAVMCIALTSARPSRMPLSRKQSSTCGVMLINPRRDGRLNQSSLR